MAQNVSKPRIYLNIPEYLASTGMTIDPVFYTLPVSLDVISTIPPTSAVTLTNPYIAILGHSATSVTLTTATVQDGGIINGDFSAAIVAGFSISKLDTMPDAIAPNNPSIGACLLGTFYDFPHSPDVNLSLSYTYDGVKEMTTKGGATLTNSFYTKPPKWGTLGAWELGGTAAYAKSGRRIWDLNFSFLSDSSVFPTNASLTTNGSTTDTLLEYDSFQRVIHLCNGGQIPFLFCSDGANPTQDNFAIAKFDMKSFKLTQSAPNLYSCKVRIKEVW